MNLTNEMGVASRITGTFTGVLTLGAGNNVGLLGVLVGSVGTAPTVQIWHGSATGAAAVVIGAITCAANAFTRVPAYCSAGATIYASGVTTPDLTIFWNPLG